MPTVGIEPTPSAKQNTTIILCWHAIPDTCVYAIIGDGTKYVTDIHANKFATDWHANKYATDVPGLFVRVKLPK